MTASKLDQPVKNRILQKSSIAKRGLTFVGLGWLVWQVYAAAERQSVSSEIDLASPDARLISVAFAVIALMLANKSSLEAGGAPKTRLARIAVFVVAFISLMLAIVGSHSELPLGAVPILMPVFGVAALLALIFIYISRHAVYVAVGFIFLAIIGNVFKINPDAVSDFVIIAIGDLWRSSDGIFGPAVEVAASYLFPFIFLGVSLQALGIDRYIAALIQKHNGKSGATSSGIGHIISSGMVSNSSSETLEKFLARALPVRGNVSAAAGHSSLIAFAQLTPPVLPAAALLMIVYLDLPLIQVFWVFGILSICVLSYLKFFTNKDCCSSLGHHRSPASAIGISLILLLGLAILFHGIQSLIVPGTNPLMILFIGGFSSLLLLARFLSLHVDRIEASDANFVDGRAHHRIIPPLMLIALIASNEMDLGLVAFLISAHALALLFLERALIFIRSPSDQQKTNAISHCLSDAFFSPIIAATIFASRLTIALTLVGITCAPLLVYGYGPTITDLVSAITLDSVVLVIAFSVFVALGVGLSLPATATYFSTILIMGPIVAAVGEASGVFISLINLHAAILLFACMADVTPPDDIASETIAKAYEANKSLVYVKILKLLLPVIFFCISVAALPIDLSDLKSAIELIVAVCLLLIGMMALGFALLESKASNILRIGFLVVGVGLLLPQYQVEAFKVGEKSIAPSEWGSQTRTEASMISARGVFEVSEEASASRGISFPLAIGEELEFSLLHDGAEIIRAENGEIFVGSIAPLSAAAQAGLEIGMKVKKIVLTYERFETWMYHTFFVAVFSLLSIFEMRNRRLS